MGDVLAVSARPSGPRHPAVCRDETSRQLPAAARPPQPPAPGRPARPDPEDVRGGVADLVPATDPLRGGRTVGVSDRRTRLGFARCLKEPVDAHSPDAERTVLAMDRRNTHSPAPLSAAVPPAEAARPAAKLEIHPPPPSTAAGRTWPSSN